MSMGVYDDNPLRKPEGVGAPPIPRLNEENRQFIIECVERGMKELGHSGSYAVFYLIKSRYGLDKKAIPDRPGEFISALEAIFGAGYKIIENGILEEMLLSGIFDSECTSFVKAVEHLRRPQVDRIGGTGPR